MTRDACQGRLFRLLRLAGGPSLETVLIFRVAAPSRLFEGAEGRVGVLVSSFPVLSAVRVDRDGKIQAPTRKNDAWGTLAC
jgi:hypothetical protein